MKKRLEYIDALKGFAIFLVVWGHSIQYLRPNDNFYHNQAFEFIYSFHMPLFFMISGYFFLSSIHLQLIPFLKKKILQLLLPCIVWAVIFLIYNLLSYLDKGQSIIWTKEIGTILNPNLWPFWFLQELFKSYLILFVAYKLLKKDWLVLICSLIFISIAPYCGMQRFLLPIFFLGIIFKRYESVIFGHQIFVVILSGFVFVASLFFWKGDYTIYVAGFPKIFHLRHLFFDFQLINISLFRLLIGLSGSMFFFLLFKMIYKKQAFLMKLSKIGYYTLAIYILQSTILERVLKQYLDFSDTNIYVYNYLITPVITIVIITICMILTQLILKSKTTGLLLLGDNYKKELVANA